MNAPDSGRRAAAREDEEARLARDLQTRILPQNLHRPGYQIAGTMVSAERVGGDFFEIIPADDGAAWIAIGDVTGHGLAAGFVMLMVQSMFSALVRQTRPPADPKEVLVALNRALYSNLNERLQDDRFVTMLAGRIDRGGHVRIAGAHTEALVRRARTGVVEIHPTPGLWIGLDAEIENDLAAVETQLDPGDLLLLTTDGVTEARGAGGELYDVKRLTAALAGLPGDSAAEVAFQIAAEVGSWTEALEDDVTVLVVRREDG